MKTEVRAFRLPLATALHTGRGTVQHREGLLLGVGDDDEMGWGEATPMPGWSSHGLAAATDVIAAAAAGLEAVGDLHDPRIDDVLDELESVPHARAAVAGALADLNARREGIPLAASLADSPLTSVAVNALATAPTPDGVAEECEAAVHDGFATLKLKVGAADPAVDLDRIASARVALGPQPALRLDANGAWDVDTAIEILEKAVDHDVMWCEEPAEGIDAIAEVGARSAVPVAVDESARTVDDLARAVGTRTIDVVVVKPQALGGPDLALRAVRLALEFEATAVVTSMIDGAVGVAHAVHVAAASGVDLAHGLATSPLLAADVGDPPSIADGSIAVPTAAGLGVVPFATVPT